MLQLFPFLAPFPPSWALSILPLQCGGSAWQQWHFVHCVPSLSLPGTSPRFHSHSSVTPCVSLLSPVWCPVSTQSSLHPSRSSPLVPHAVHERWQPLSLAHLVSPPLSQQMSSVSRLGSRCGILIFVLKATHVSGTGSHLRAQLSPPACPPWCHPCPAPRDTVVPKDVHRRVQVTPSCCAGPGCLRGSGRMGDGGRWSHCPKDW